MSVEGRVLVTLATVGLALTACGTDSRSESKIDRTTTTSSTTTTTIPTTTTLPPPPPTTAPPPPPTTALPPPPPNCNPNYSDCVPNASDVDCAGGTGDGPAYTGPVRVTGVDVYDLDRDRDGYACE
jgi:hypothetical protein